MEILQTTKETATKETKKKLNQRRTPTFHWFYHSLNYILQEFLMTHYNPKKERGKNERIRFSSCKKEEEEEQQQQAAMLQKNGY